jgi:pilus assembly protein Flp/PilA
MVRLFGIYSRRDNIMLFAPEEKGQGLVEYALIIALIAILLIAALGLVTGALNKVFSRISSAL